MNNPTEAGGSHYGEKLQPFNLTRDMESSGSAHVDGCRCVIIKYAFRIKEKGVRKIPKMIDDLRKAAHYANEAADTLEKSIVDENQMQLELMQLPYAELPQRQAPTNLVKCEICGWSYDIVKEYCKCPRVGESSFPHYASQA